MSLGTELSRVSNIVGRIGAFLDDPMTQATGMGGEMMPLVEEGVRRDLEKLGGLEYIKNLGDRAEAVTSARVVHFRLWFLGQAESILAPDYMRGTP